ncbi:hypothetical protein EQW78_12400 [Oerskovia turbata]|uniref:Uncharacterized protein n=1 Tax=Oerskovia turbata TaxID=1713 RepID=A0A4Q1KU83_9CELL|nr:hypothetical protein [Oerskovia turbata]RXR25637.1 hypothetical protein EQW73_08945 [Oerskovia turbata]RXR33275.1 hypothetical protein EQW78_12400 [Oerskovia turbata]TGJ96345.1 hypothetical protein DLJ96_11510 [Actinotalea fermentans ATCC 43279 = JCM 9966 = DSM 3133]
MSPSTPTPDVNAAPDGPVPAAPPESGAAAPAAPAPLTTPAATDTVSTEPGDVNDGGIRGDEVEIESVVDPTTIRRAPRYKAFFMTGALVGVVLGLCLGIVWLGSPESLGVLKPGVYLTVVVLGTTTLTTLVAGALAIWADRRSLRR